MGGRSNDYRDIKQFVILRAGEPIHFTVERGGHEVELVATPANGEFADR